MLTSVLVVSNRVLLLTGGSKWAKIELVGHIVSKNVFIHGLLILRRTLVLPSTQTSIS